MIARCQIHCTFHMSEFLQNNAPYKDKHEYNRKMLKNITASTLQGQEIFYFCKI